MQAYASQQLGEDIIYLSPMHITQRAISGYDIPDTLPKLVNLTGLQRVEVRVKMRGEIMYRRTIHLKSHEEGTGQWLYPCRAPIRVS